jgi:hypothetical protein
MKIRIIFAITILISDLGFGQNAFEVGIWKHTSLNGSIELEGLYRSQETILRNNSTEKPVTTLLTGNLQLNSKSYIWHPNFLKLNTILEYNPALRDQNYLVIPNRSETRTAEQLRISATFFEERPLSFNTFYNFNHIFINRELATSVETYTKEAGAGLSFRNTYLPITMRYLDSQWDQNELDSGRKFRNNRKNLRAEAGKSFSNFDDHRLSFSNDDYSRTYAGKGKVHNIVSNARIRNNITFNNGKQNYWRSLISYQDQTGTFPLKRFQVDENAKISLPYNFSTSGFYRYSRFEQQSHVNRQHNILGRLEQQLFKSLNSYTYYEYINFKNTVYDESIHQAAVGFRYTKVIARGRFNLSYEHRLRSDDRDSQPSLLKVFDEELLLSDNTITFLKNPDADPASILITDETGIVIYQENIDYLVIQRDSYIEIQRLPGGQIEDNQLVMADYISSQNSSYDFRTNTNQFQIGLNLFERLAELYFRYYDQNYSDININEKRILKTISQRVAGIRSSYGFLSGGFEIEGYNSNLLPYILKRIFLGVNTNFYRKVNINLSGNYRDYNFVDADESQKFFDISGRINYQLSLNSKISLDGGYRFQNGRGIDLKLTNLRTEYSTKYRSMLFHVGMEIYRRDFSKEIINYNGGYIRVERKF